MCINIRKQIRVLTSSVVQVQQQLCASVTLEDGVCFGPRQAVFLVGGMIVLAGAGRAGYLVVRAGK